MARLRDRISKPTSHPFNRYLPGLTDFQLVPLIKQSRAGFYTIQLAKHTLDIWRYFALGGEAFEAMFPTTAVCEICDQPLATERTGLRSVRWLRACLWNIRNVNVRPIPQVRRLLEPPRVFHRRKAIFN